jgi:hypothetical protein
MNIDGFEIDLTGLRMVPAFVNAHDHLEFALFPRLGNGVYPNAAAWARDIYRPDASPIRDHLRVPKRIRLVWGGLRNLVAGATEVWHHNPWHPVFEDGFPVRVLKRFGWAHSLTFAPDIVQRFAATPPGEPFIVHAAEGTDRASADEVFRLNEIGILGPRTVLVHAVGIDDEGWDLVRASGASVVWCPRSNLFTLGKTLVAEYLERLGIPFALGADSPLTAEGDLLDEIRIAGPGRVQRSGDLIAVSEVGDAPDLVIMDGSLRLISERLARGAAPPPWSPLHIEGRPRVFVPLDTVSLIRETRDALQSDEIRLGGRRVLS